MQDSSTDDPMDRTDDQIPRIYASTLASLRASVTRRCGGDSALAEDVVQETWLRALSDWRKKGIPERPAAWLATTSRNVLLNEYRRRRPDTLGDVDPVDHRAADPAALLDAAETSAAVRDGLERLPVAERRLLEAFHFERIPVAQIAAPMEISARAVEGRLRRARIRLGQELEWLRARSRARTAPRASRPVYGVGPSIGSLSSVKGLLMTTLLAMLLAIAVFPLSLLTRRIPRRRLGLIRVLSGAGLIVLGMAAAPDGRLLQAFGVGVMLWGGWMLRRDLPPNAPLPRRAVG